MQAPIGKAVCALTKADKVVWGAPLCSQLDLANQLHPDALVLNFLGGQWSDTNLQAVSEVVWC